MSYRSARESFLARVISDFVMCHSSATVSAPQRSGDGIRSRCRLRSSARRSGDCPIIACCQAMCAMVWSSSVDRTTVVAITKVLSEPLRLFGARCENEAKRNGQPLQLPPVSLLYRSPSFVLLASTAGVAIGIKNRAGEAHKRS